ncbi:MAG: PaaI family thioesterase [Dehalococcoidia bacterium]
MSDDARAGLLAALDGLGDEQVRTLAGWARMLHREPGARAGEGSVGPLGDALGIEREDVSPGQARMRLTVNPMWANPNGILHGGVVYTLIDYSMGGAVQTSLPAGDFCASINVAVSYLAPVRDGALVVDTEVVRQGRSIAFVESKVRDDAGRLIATASGTMFIFRAPPE